jgi:hypothetical protein
MDRFVRHETEIAGVAEDHLVPGAIIGSRPAAPPQGLVGLQQRFDRARLVVGCRKRREFALRPTRQDRLARSGKILQIPLRHDRAPRYQILYVSHNS